MRLDLPQTSVSLRRENLLELLGIRAPTELSSLVTLEEVREQLAFHATGPDGPVGVIAMSLTGGTGDITDVLVVVNADIDEVTIDDPAIATGDWQLHPVQEASYDELVRESAAWDGAFTVPARTTAAFVQMEPEPVPGPPGRPGPRPGIGPGGPTWWQVPAFATFPGRGR